jgi:hypothetical protein
MTMVVPPVIGRTNCDTNITTFHWSTTYSQQGQGSVSGRTGGLETVAVVHADNAYLLSRRLLIDADESELELHSIFGGMVASVRNRIVRAI